jgi:uncharacterized protein (TIGR02145 family)
MKIQLTNAMANSIRPLLAATLGLALAFTFSCSSGDDSDGSGSPSSGGDSAVPCSGGPITIGTQTWLKCNLDVVSSTGNSKCYGEGGQVIVGTYFTTLSNAEIQANCVKYGRLYDWATAMALPSKCNSDLSASDADCAISVKHRGICPSNYHIPTETEWSTLVDFAGGSEVAGKKLKSKSGWNDNGNGTDDYGFSALPGGLDIGISGYVGDSGLWWSATEKRSANFAYYYGMHHYNEKVDRIDNSSKSGLFSVRCLQD